MSTAHRSNKSKSKSESKATKRSTVKRRASARSPASRPTARGASDSARERVRGSHTDAATRRAEPHVPVPVEPSELSAQPMGLEEELSVHLRGEEGLSMEPEEMGRQYLSDAIEQGDFESTPEREADELQVDSGPSSDRALSGPNLEAEDDVWENTVNQTLEAGTPDRALDELSPAPAAVERQASARERVLEGKESEEAFDELDLSDPDLHEASLFDHEASELGAVEAPELKTEDAHHSKRKPRS